MLRSSESETEILLGNKQLVGIFFLVAVLLGVAFTSGYMIGRGSTPKKGAAAAETASSTAAPAAGGSGGETHAVTPADSGTGQAADQGQPGAADTAADSGGQTPAPEAASPTPAPEEQPLGARHKKTEAAKAPAQTAEANTAEPAAGFTPQSGQEFLQVAAVARGDANSIADVLRKKGFRAHAVPAPSNSSLYRVLVGPIRDAGDLATTRDSLRKTGFRDVIVQRYK
ncbi:MAG: SPOR domain-containing protein [Acidobacteriaceae bacterium]|nr:SPOR domain-containing protein [Acidobacteriaceae bacterium]